MESPSKYSAFNVLFLIEQHVQECSQGGVRNMTSQTLFRLYSDIACNMHYNYEFLTIVTKEKLLVENI